MLVFSRMESRRLPSKAFADIAGRPLLGHVVDRAMLVCGNPVVIVATSVRPEDDKIQRWCEKEGVLCFRGSSADVVSRAISCCEEYSLDSFARVCGDRPFHDPKIIDELYDLLETENLELATTLLPRALPPGLTGEVLRLSALRRASELGMDADDKEHVTRVFYRSPGVFRIGNFAPKHPVPDDISLVVDTEADLDRARWIANRLDSATTAPLSDVVALARAWELERTSLRLGKL